MYIHTYIYVYIHMYVERDVKVPECIHIYTICMYLRWSDKNVCKYYVHRYSYDQYVCMSIYVCICIPHFENDISMYIYLFIYYYWHEYVVI